jgi:hypothetical protein
VQRLEGENMRKWTEKRLVKATEGMCMKSKSIILMKNNRKDISGKQKTRKGGDINICER